MRESQHMVMRLKDTCMLCVSSCAVEGGAIFGARLGQCSTGGKVGWGNLSDSESVLMIQLLGQQVHTTVSLQVSLEGFPELYGWGRVI